MQLVILAGGKGTRMGPLAQGRPKPMVPLAGKPLVQHQIELARRYGVREVLLLTGHLGEVIEDYFGDGRGLGVHISYCREPAPLGTARALRAAADWVRGDFLVGYGDVVFDVDLDALRAFHAARRPLATLAVHPNNHPHDSDLLAADAQDRVTAFYPKPRPADACHRNLVNAALYVLSPEILDHIPPASRPTWRGIFPRLVAAGQPLAAYRTAEYIADVGTPERLRRVEGDLRAGRVAARNRRQPRPAIFLDRDGVLNRECGHLVRPEDLELLPGAARAVRQINEAGWLAVVVTNQPAVAKGLLDETGLDAIHARLETELGREGAWLDAIDYCPHYPEAGYPGERPELKVPCACRKPAAGMLFHAAARWNIDLARSWIVGDRTVDIRAGAAAGVGTVLVRTGCGGQDGKYPCRPDVVVDDLAAAVGWILEQPAALPAAA